MNIAGAAEIRIMQTYVREYSAGSRIERHSHDLDQLTVVTESPAIVETDDAFIAQHGTQALWLPAGSFHSISSSRRFTLHALYFEPPVRSVADSDTRPEVLKLNALARDLVMFLCRASAGGRALQQAHAFSLLMVLLEKDAINPFCLRRPRGDRARKLADHFTAHPSDDRALDNAATEIGGTSLRTFERLFLKETGLSVSGWRRKWRLFTSLALLLEGRSVGEVARSVGYGSSPPFCSAFKQCFGVSPAKYASNGRASRNSAATA